MQGIYAQKKAWDKLRYTQYTSDFSNRLNDSYHWYTKVLGEKISECISDYLMREFNFKLVGISEKDNVFFFGDDYFVTQIKIDKVNNVFFRISTSLIDMMLTSLFGKSREKFAAERITELEAKILTSLNDYIQKGIMPFLPIKSSDECDNHNLVHLTFFVKNGSGHTGKLIISIPIVMIPDSSPVDKKINFTLGSFPRYKVPVNILTGTSKITLSDAKNIEEGDIVLLENSNIKSMVVDFCGNKKVFTLTPDPSLIAAISDDDGGRTMANVHSEDAAMWDVIPVEISAEFENIKITLGELKQISEGVVVDIASVYENKIFLKVENKPIAAGELIIINDKYAVRVDEVFAEKPKKPLPPPPPPKPTQKTPPPPPPPKQTASVAPGGDKDFDYDNFDIEDEDI